MAGNHADQDNAQEDNPPPPRQSKKKQMREDIRVLQQRVIEAEEAQQRAEQENQALRAQVPQRGRNAAAGPGAGNVEPNAVKLSKSEVEAWGSRARVAGGRAAALYDPFLDTELLAGHRVQTHIDEILDDVKRAQDSDGELEDDQNPAVYWDTPRFELPGSIDMVHEGVRKQRSELAHNVYANYEKIFDFKNAAFEDRLARPNLPEVQAHRNFLHINEKDDDGNQNLEVFFRDVIIVKVLRLLLFGKPATQTGKRSAKARQSHSKSWHIAHITPSLLAYAATVIRFICSMLQNQPPEQDNGLYRVNGYQNPEFYIHGFHRRGSMYRSPGWITSVPLFFLAGSAIAFLAGLCVFAYSSDQSPVVSVVVTSLTVITGLALFGISLWFISERWSFARVKRGRWLLDVEDYCENISKVVGITLINRAVRSCVKSIKRTMTSASERVVVVAERMGSAVDLIKGVPRDLISRMMSPLVIVTDGAGTDVRGDEEAQDGTYRTDSPANMFHGDDGSGCLGVNGQSETCKLSDVGKGNEEPIPEHAPLSLDTRLSPPVLANPPGTVPTIPGSSSSTANAGPSEQTQANARFKALTRRVIDNLKMVPQSQAPSPPSISSMSSPLVMSDSRHRRDSSEHELTPARIQTYVPMLRTMRSSQVLPPKPVGLAKHLQFSPDGQFLATCSWDRTALIWRLGTGPQGEFELMHELVHTTRVGGFAGQVAWSPNGEQLLAKKLQSIEVWDSKNGVCERTIDRKRSVQTITWMPKGSRFLSIEWRMDSSQTEKKVSHTENILGSDLVVVSTNGVQNQEYHLDRLQVWDAAVVPDEERLVAVATLLRPEQDRRPAVKSRPEKRILIFNLRTQEIENQVPLLQDVRGVTLTEEGNYALVSYKNKAPPQAWRIDKILREGKQRLVLAHTYFTKHPVDFAGPSYFGGVKDTFVLAPSKSGEIYIWERSSGVLLHSLKTLDQDLTSFAWSHKAPSGFMFAYATNDGMVRIWTAPTFALPPRRLVPSLELQQIQSPGPLRQEYLVASPPASPRAI